MDRPPRSIPLAFFFLFRFPPRSPALSLSLSLSLSHLHGLERQIQPGQARDVFAQEALRVVLSDLLAGHLEEKEGERGKERKKESQNGAK